MPVNNEEVVRRLILDAAEMGRRGRFLEALSKATQAVHCDPRSFDAQLCLGQSLLAAGKKREAHGVAIELHAGNWQRPSEHNALGTLLTFCDDPTRALVHFQRAVQGSSQNTGYLYNLASAQRMVGDLAAAEGTLNALLRIAPLDAQAHLMRADLRVQETGRNHVAELEGALRRTSRGNVDAVVALSFAIAKELEDIGEYDRSFHYLERANSLQRARYKYDVSDDIETLHSIIRVHDRSMLSASRGVQNEQPIFIVGLPRSGTTLIAQILASHSRIRAAAELQAMPTTLVGLVRQKVDGEIRKHQFVDYSRHLAPQEIANAYLEAAEADMYGNDHFIDKQPINYLYLGLISMALPSAKIIAVLREPMDTCYAIYKTLFTNAYPFGYSLEELGRYYIAWDALMKHWQAMLGSQILFVKYEQLVESPRETVRTMLEHCGLQWEEACLQGQHSNRAVTTASAAQVRQPIHNRFVGRSRHFMTGLAPLSRVLESPNHDRFLHTTL